MLSFLRLSGPIFLLTLLFCSTPSPALADHEGPERVVDGKYVILLSMLPEGESMKMIFFRDMRTGKPLSIPVTGSVTILDPNTTQAVMQKTPFSTSKRTDGDERDIPQRRPVRHFHGI